MSDEPRKQQGVGGMLAEMAGAQAVEPMAARLSHVMTRVGAPTLAAFYSMLTEGGVPEGFPTYEAARTYHGKPFRDPPTSYLALILERFPAFDARWLLTGKGEPARGVTPSPLRDGIREAFALGLMKSIHEPLLSHATLEAAEKLTYRTYGEVATQYPRETVSFDAVGQHYMIDFANDLGGAIGMAAAKLIGSRHKSRVSTADLDAFALAFIASAEALIPLSAATRMCRYSSRKASEKGNL